MCAKRDVPSDKVEEPAGPPGDRLPVSGKTASGSGLSKAIVSEIKREHRACMLAGRRVVLHAAAAGKALAMAKEEVGHGSWTEWLRENVPHLTERTAQRYMKVRKNLRDIARVHANRLGKPTPVSDEEALELLSDLTLSEALQLAPKRRLSDSSSRRRKAKFPRNVKDNHWRTPDHIIRAAEAVMGHIDLDPAAAEGQRHVPANTAYTTEQNSLAPDVTWSGNVFLSPGSEGDLRPWVAKAVESYRAGTVKRAVLVLPALMHAEWVSLLAGAARAFCREPLKVKCTAAPEEEGVLPNPQMIVYLGPKADHVAFARAFSEFADVFLPAEIEMENLK